MKPVNQIVGVVVVEAAERSTKEPRVITPKVENFDWQFDTRGEAEREKMLLAAKNFASAVHLNEDARWLTLLGPTGIGKTHLAKKVLGLWRAETGWKETTGKAGAFYRLGESRFVSWRLFVDRQRNGNYSEVAGIIESELVVIDDVGAEHDPNGYAKSLLDKIADARLNKWTVFTCNLSLEQIAAEIDPRVSSRMLRGENVVIKSVAKDFNLGKLRPSSECGVRSAE